MSKLFVTKTTEKKLSKDIERIFLKVTKELSWLKRGDTVLLKPALNSGSSYPATTHPLAVAVIRRILTTHGAKVIIGDQSGIEHVVHTPTGVLRGSSRELFLRSGMGTSRMNFIGFEELDWHLGFSNFNSKKISSWQNGFFVSNLVQEVDHIINLPRLSTHVCAGVSLGLKNMVGILRQDSRIELHADGPFSKQINSFSRGSELRTDYADEERFLEKIAEISLSIQNKLRLTLYVGTEAQTVFGPDARTVNLLKAINPKINEKIVFASDDLVASETFAYAFLKYLQQHKTPTIPKKLESLLFFKSRKNHLSAFKPWENPAIKHAQKIGLGNVKFEIDWGDVSEELKTSLNVFR